MGFLNATPEGERIPRLTKLANALRTRGEAMTDFHTGMPEFPASEYMMRAFMRLRPARPGMGGPEPWTWVDVEAFGRASQMISDPWEHEALIDMSHAYCAELASSTNVLTIPPTERDNP